MLGKGIIMPKDDDDVSDDVDNVREQWLDSLQRAEERKGGRAEGRAAYLSHRRGRECWGCHELTSPGDGAPPSPRHPGWPELVATQTHVPAWSRCSLEKWGGQCRLFSKQVTSERKLWLQGWSRTCLYCFLAKFFGKDNAEWCALFQEHVRVCSCTHFNTE